MAKQPVEPELIYIVSKTHRKIQIKKENRYFPNKEHVEFVFQPGIPLQVPSYMKNYAESYPHVFSIISNEEAEAILADPPEVKPEAQTAQTQENFNVVEFLNNAHPLSAAKLEPLTDRQVFLIAAKLDLNPTPGMGKGKLIEQIITEVEVRNQK
jgi:hypothetical protein